MSDSAAQEGAPAQPQRRRLVLKPRSEEAAKKLEEERQAHLSKANPFGAAKPREAVIAEKLGKTEEEVLKEEVSKEKLHLRLSGAQLEEKRQAETDIKEIEEVLALETEGSAKHAELSAELKERQKKLDELMETFAKVTLETALSGSAPRVSQIRQQQQLTQQQSGDVGYSAVPAGSFPPRSSFGGREFNEAPYGGGRGGGGAAAGTPGAPAADQPRGFRNYQQRGGFSDSYQERQGGSYGGGRRGGGGGQRLPEWALDDSSDAGFYDAPAATSAFIASGGYQGAAAGGGGYGGGRGGRGGGGGGGGGRRGGGRSYGNGGYGDGYPSGRGLGGEFEYKEEPSSFGTGQDRF